MIAGLIGIWSQVGLPLKIALFKLVCKCATIIADVIVDLHNSGLQMVLGKSSETTMRAVCIYQRAPSLKIVWSLLSRICLGYGRHVLRIELKLTRRSFIVSVSIHIFFHFRVCTSEFVLFHVSFSIPLDFGRPTHSFSLLRVHHQILVRATGNIEIVLNVAAAEVIDMVVGDVDL